MIAYSTRVVVITCKCGMLPLASAMHRSSAQAWPLASAHVALNPGKCHPAMTWRYVAPCVAAGLPAPTEPPMTDAFRTF